MYYVNMEQIEVRLQFIPVINEGIAAVLKDWADGQIIYPLAQERLLQLAIETVTDVGSYMIDGLMMREASSYEDIIIVLHDEQVFSEETKDVLLSLVQCRRPLVQNYYDFDRQSGPHSLLGKLPDTLRQFAEKTRDFLHKELQDFS